MKALPADMLALRIHHLMEGDKAPPLVPERVPVPSPGKGEFLIKVSACGVCHTELDTIAGRTAPPSLPVTPGHQVVGRIVTEGAEIQPSRVGERVGVAWIHSACGHCRYCHSGRENLCEDFRGCGRDHDGGYAEYLVAPSASAIPLPKELDPVTAAPLLCAGAVGWRALRQMGLENGQVAGLTGFGASNHLVLQMLRHRYPDSPVMVFARNPEERQFARELGAAWAGDTRDLPPQPCQAILDTTPAWQPVLSALEALVPGGRLVINAIAKEAGDQAVLQGLDYPRHLWREKQLVSVTNVTRQDVRECLELAVQIPLQPATTLYPLAEANRALDDLRQGLGNGAKVLVMGSTSCRRTPTPEQPGGHEPEHQAAE